MSGNRPLGGIPSARRALPADSGSPQGHHRATRSAGPTFRNAIGFTILGTLIPGVGLIRAGRKVPGWIILGFTIAFAGTIAALAVFRRQWLIALAVNPTFLYGLAVALLVAGVVWVATIVATHVSLRPRPATMTQRSLGAVLVGVLAFAVAAPLAFGAQLSYTQGSLVQTLFGGDNTTATTTKIDAADPWKDKDRLNILILGGDSGGGRASSLGARTDSVMVASIDTHSGATTLFQLPRQTARMPFPKDSPLYAFYPKGFYNGNPSDGEYMLNAMYDNVGQRTGTAILGPTSNFGADVVKLSVGEALGLKLDYYVFVNLDGFVDIIDALGGISLNVNWTVAIGGNEDAVTGKITVKPVAILQPEPDVHLDGTWALAYARSRLLHDDYHRQVQQRCVINAVLKKADPASILANYESIARAGKKTILTDVPSTMLPSMADLALKVKNGNLQSVGFMDGVGGYDSANPNFTEMRAYVQQVLTAQTAAVSSGTSASPTASASASSASVSATPTAQPTSTKSTPTKSTPTPTTTKTPLGAAQDLTDQCAYHPTTER